MLWSGVTWSPINPERVEMKRSHWDFRVCKISTTPYHPNPLNKLASNLMILKRIFFIWINFNVCEVWWSKLIMGEPNQIVLKNTARPHYSHANLPFWVSKIIWFLGPFSYHWCMLLIFLKVNSNMFITQKQLAAHFEIFSWYTKRKNRW